MFMNKYLSKVSLNIEPLTIDICNPDDKQYRHYELGLDTINPKMKSFLESLGVGVIMVEVFYTPPFMERGIHIDTPNGGDITKLNWLYCEGEHRMHWYNQKAEGEVQQNRVATKLIHFTKDQVELIHTETLTTNNVLVHVGVPHNVRNLRHRRWAICLTICKLNSTNRITVAESQQIFKDYIIE
jgi:hypothetical protein